MSLSSGCFPLRTPAPPPRRIRHQHPSVMSISLGGPSEGFYAGERAFLKALQVGIITVVAAGNSAWSACDFWPAQSQWVITVGSTDAEDYRSSFSNYGPCVTLYAPGTAIDSTVPGAGAGRMSGTSMACPVVSGAVALYLERRPKAEFMEVSTALLRNAVGQRGGAPALRMLLLHVHDRSPWRRDVGKGGREMKAQGVSGGRGAASTGGWRASAAALGIAFGVAVLVRAGARRLRAGAATSQTASAEDYVCVPMDCDEGPGDRDTVLTPDALSGRRGVA